jgi:CRP/FNR family transcriptional regulator, cyclic AMP receptor protein
MNEDIFKKVDGHFSKYPKRSYPKGQILIFADENPEHIFYIVKGKIRKYSISYNGDEVVVNVFKPPAFFPMSWALNKDKNSFFYKTETETELHVVPTQDAYDFLIANPDVTLDLLSRVYVGTEGLLGRMVHLMSGTAKSRLLYELVIECRRFGKKGNGKDVALSVNEVDLAARSGLSRETVSREMKKLKTNNLIKLDGKTLIVSNVAALEKAVGGEI